jgi:hypothetical protein
VNCGVGGGGRVKICEENFAADEAFEGEGCQHVEAETTIQSQQ